MVVAPAMIAKSLVNDWPRRHELDGGARPAAPAVEGRYALDAFPLQLLGPGYEGRVPSQLLYRAQRAGAGLASSVQAWSTSPVEVTRPVHV